MDVRRSCAKSVMFWDDAQTVSSTVRWYFTDEPFLPFPHRFSSEIWDETHWVNPGAGETDKLPQTYDKGALPSPVAPVPRGAPCGPPEWFANGAPSNAPPLEWLNGIPSCCGAKILNVGGIHFGAPPATVPGCAQCALGAKARWTLTGPTPFLNDSCDECSVLDAFPFTLSYVPALSPGNDGTISNGCFWESLVLPQVSTHPPFDIGPCFWRLWFDSFVTSQWFIEFHVGLTVILQWAPINAGSFACLGPNTFTPPVTSVLCCDAPSGNLTVS